MRLVREEAESFSDDRCGAERRRSERVPFIVEAWLRSPTCPNERIEVVSVNLSRHGVAFQMDHPLGVGEYHVLEIGLGEERLICKSVVRRCGRLDDGSYEIGAEFC